MVRRSLLTIVAVLLVVAGCVVVSTPAGAVVDSATIASSPNPSPSFNELRSVSCVSASSCLAVGTEFNAPVNSPLVLAWDGEFWVQVASPDFGNGGGSLDAASCVSPSSCTAVGSYSENGSPSETLVMVWDGVSWNRLSSPNIGTGSNVLSSVSCVSVSSCTAVGNHDDAGTWKTLVLVWDGISWTHATSPNYGVGSNYLVSVSCVSATWCVAVGDYLDSGSKTLVLVGDGATWTQGTSPNPSAASNALNSVSCVSTSICTAVGYTYTGILTETVALIWDGITWTRVASPNSSDTENVLNSVSCATTTSCSAVGVYIDNDFVFRTMVLAWDGSTWSPVPSPSPGTVEDQLESVSCGSEFLCLAVGYTVSGSVTETLVLSLTGREPAPTTTTTSASSDPVAPAFAG